MSDPDGEALLPHPGRDAQALRAAVAQLAPHRLETLDYGEKKARRVAAQEDDVRHIQWWLTYWAIEVEILRRPDLRKRLLRAEAVLEETDGNQDPRFRSAMDEIRAVHAESEREWIGER